MPTPRIALFLAMLLGVASCAEDPASLHSLPRGAFAGVNTGLLSTLITNTTNMGGDTVDAVVVAAEVSAMRGSGEQAESRRFRGLGLFEIDGMASEIGGVTANGVPLAFDPDSPPRHYRLDTTGPTVLNLERMVDWRASWPTGETIEARATLPKSFGTITLSPGSQISVAALDAGDTVRVEWTGVVPQTRVFMYVSWQPEVFAPTLVMVPVPVLVVEDKGFVTIPGKHLSQMIRQPDGRLSFVLYRGTYETATRFDNGTRALATFSYLADSVRLDLVP